jgi:hypothetical protein
MWGKHPEILVQTDHMSKKELVALLREAYENAVPALKRRAAEAARLPVTRAKQHARAASYCGD